METPEIFLLRLPAVRARTGLSRARLYALIQGGLFPQSVRLAGGRAVAWRSDEVAAWIDARPRSRSTA